MNTLRSRTAALLCVIGAGLLTACSGGTEGTGASSRNGPQNVSVGVVTALGSVQVNDVHYRTQGSVVSDDDGAAGEGDFEVGQNVVVRGSIDKDGMNGKADSVMVYSMIKGPVDSLYDAQNNSLGVLGQTVQITDQTRIHPSIDGGLAALLLGDEVQVHGHVVANGVIEATLIKKVSAPLHDYRLVGLAQYSSGTTFTIGGLTVDFSQAHTESLSGGVPANGQLVKVKGPAAVTAGTWMAAVVTPAGLGGDDYAHVEVEGYVTTMADSTHFTINDTPVVTDGSTHYRGGLAGDIGLGIKLEAEGAMVDGVLQAHMIKFRHNVRIEGTVESNDGVTMTVAGLSGIAIKVNAPSFARDAASTVDGTQSLVGGVPAHDVPAVGEGVRVDGYETAGNNVTASRVRGANGNSGGNGNGNSNGNGNGGGNKNGNRVVLQAAVDAVVAGSSFTVLGVVVDTSAPGFELQSDGEDMAGGERTVSAEEFYAMLKVGMIVKVRGDENAGVITWMQAEIDN